MRRKLMSEELSQTDLKRAIEAIEQINHSGSGRLAGIETEASNIRADEKGVTADVVVKGPTEGKIRKYENLTYSYNRIRKAIGSK